MSTDNLMNEEWQKRNDDINGIIRRCYDLCATVRKTTESAREASSKEEAKRLLRDAKIAARDTSECARQVHYDFGTEGRVWLAEYDCNRTETEIAKKWQ